MEMEMLMIFIKLILMFVDDDVVWIEVDRIVEVIVVVEVVVVVNSFKFNGLTILMASLFSLVHGSVVANSFETGLIILMRINIGISDKWSLKSVSFLSKLLTEMPIE